MKQNVCCQTIITPVEYVTFYLSPEQVAPVVLSAARNEGMSEVVPTVGQGVLWALCGVCGQGTGS